MSAPEQMRPSELAEQQSMMDLVEGLSREEQEIFDGKTVLFLSNRLPVAFTVNGNGELQSKETFGGLVTALTPVVKLLGKRIKAVWGGWPGFKGEPEEKEGLEEAWRTSPLTNGNAELGIPHLAPVILTERQYDQYYNEMANGVLWFGLHGGRYTKYCDFETARAHNSFETYREVNKLFKDVALQNTTEEDPIIVNDYHLMLASRYIREARPKQPILFYLHTPFPSQRDFDILNKGLGENRGVELLNGMLGADSIAFPTTQDRNKFITCLRTYRNLLPSMTMDERPDGTIDINMEGRTIRVKSIPIGIDVKEFSTLAQSEEVEQKAAEFAAKYPGYNTGQVARLDLTKEFARGLLTFSRMLETHPEMLGQSRYFAIAPRSREENRHYKHLAKRIDQLVEVMNRKYDALYKAQCARRGITPDPNWHAVEYFKDGLGRRDLLALYKNLKVYHAPGIRDGTNLTPYEFIASNPDGLVAISRFIGAGRNARHAKRINPYDLDQNAKTLYNLLTASPDQVRRMRPGLEEDIRNHSSDQWTLGCMRQLAQVMIARQAA